MTPPEGFRGRAAIEWFWDNVIAPAETTRLTPILVPRQLRLLDGGK